MTDEQFSYFTSLFSELGLDKNSEIDSIIVTIKQLFVESRNDRELLSRNIDTYLIPAIEEKNTNAEVSTPYFLRKEMLDKIPDEEFVKLGRILESCCGKAGFLIDIVNRFLLLGFDMRTIIEDKIYFADINPFNVFIACLLLNPEGKYKVNAFVGDTLQMTFDFKFDAVIGNPPYQSGKKGSGNILWQEFVRKSLNEWIADEGYLCFVHPAGWRKPEFETSKSKTLGMFELMTRTNTMIKLVIRGLVDGKKVFKCGTRYDYYLIKKTPNIDMLTEVSDEHYNKFSLDLKEWKFLPNHNFDSVKKLLAGKDEECVDVLYNTIYDSRKLYVSREKSDTYKYPLIHSTPKDGVRYCYSSVNDKGHFGISKVIFGDSGVNHVVTDTDGLYGMTEHSIAIVDDVDVFDDIKKALLSNAFRDIVHACSWSNYQINGRLLTHFKKDFYKELVI